MLAKLKSLLIVTVTAGLLAGSVGVASASEKWTGVKPASEKWTGVSR